MTRTFFAFVLVCTVWAATAAGFGAPQAGSSLEEIFTRMDKAAAAFKGLTADIRQVSHTEVVSTDDTEEGTLIAKRFRPKDTRFLVQMTRPDPKSYFVGEGKLRIFNTKTQEAQEADLGKSKDLVNQFMLLAFGSNSSELRGAYTIKAGGPETVKGEKTTRIEMTPKSADTLKYIKRCDMWMSDKGVAIQQKFFETGGDYVLTTYTNMVLNPSISDSALRLEIPKGVKITKLK
jgi:outer membrane lipoprotein-sorting protein